MSYNLVQVYKDTVSYCLHNNLPTGNSTKYYCDAVEFKDDIFLQKYSPFDTNAIVLVENIDSFSMAIKINNANDNCAPLVLNFASNIYPGGGVERGARAQEEDLFRKSNYFQTLHQYFYIDGLENNAVIYSPMVCVIKDDNYKLLEKPVCVSCIAVAAINNPQIIKQLGKIAYADPNDYTHTQSKIDMIFKVAILNGHVNLVLGALGCGVFNNPPELVAKMFKNSIAKYGKFFKRIGFAVLSKSPSDMNYVIFDSILS